MPKPFQRKPGGPFYFRLRVPADLVSAVGRTHVERSLRTRDPDEAKRLFQIEAGKHMAGWEALRRGPQAIPLRTLMALCGEHYADWLAQLDEEPGEPSLWEAVAGLNQRIAAADAEGRESWYGPTADALLTRHGLCADPASRARLIEQLHETMLRATETLHRRADGDYGPDPHASRFPAPMGPPSASAGVSSGPESGDDKASEEETLTGLFASWERHRRKGRDKTARDFLQKVQALITFVGSDRTADVTPAKVRLWLDQLEGSGLTANTIGQKYLAAVRTVYRHATNRALPIPDPTAGMKVRGSTPPKTRERGFTAAEALGILRAAREGRGVTARVSPHMARAVRWVPWVCALTGARVTEITQLRREDVFQVGDIPCIRITPEAGSTKTGEYRIVPLHPQLIREGFLAAVGPLPPGPVFHAPGKAASGVSRKLAAWVRKHGGATDPAVQPNHGWRHHFKTLSRDAEVAGEWSDPIQGHRNPRAAEGYGERTVKALYREVCKLPDYPL